MKNENALLEETLAIAAEGYAPAYRFLLSAYEAQPHLCGPQTFYFLACLAGGNGQPETALKWLEAAIQGRGWWYRPEVLEDDDLGALQELPAFLALKAVSDRRYAEAAATAKPICTRTQKTADKLFLAVHGNTQNGQTARDDWTAALDGLPGWQLETVQSGEPDGCGTYRWSYDRASSLPVADALEEAQGAGYGKIACGGFSAGCDMLLRAVTFSPARCDLLLLQSPWIPMLEEHSPALLDALRQKGIVLRIFCGTDDEDCLPMARQLQAAASAAGVDTALTLQDGSRHQFPDRPLDPAFLP